MVDSSAAKSEHEVAVVHCIVGVGGAVHAEHVQRQWRMVSAAPMSDAQRRCRACCDYAGPA